MPPKQSAPNSFTFQVRSLENVECELDIGNPPSPIPFDRLLRVSLMMTQAAAAAAVCLAGTNWEKT
ncbi:hypothetical protein TYRP_017478 [Tyrophagus putrescentiae]|nr:hypothetical protein TYRP_017478 [Tyrophagus putrescentiae]